MKKGMKPFILLITRIKLVGNQEQIFPKWCEKLLPIMASTNTADQKTSRPDIPSGYDVNVPNAHVDLAKSVLGDVDNTIN